MATNQVKFIQIGNSTTKYNETTYTEKLNQAKLDFPGAVIFGTYFNDKDKQLLEIWANGQSYSVGSGSSNFEYFYGDIDVVNGELINLVTTENGVTTYHVWNSAGDSLTNSFSPEHGYIYVYTRPGNNEGIEAKTAYVYDENATLKNSSGTVSKTGLWKALSGNVNAENVWFPTGVQRTETWGAATTKNTTVQDECVGYNLKALLENYLVKTVWPMPTYSLTAAPTFTATDGNITIPSDTPSEYLLVPSGGTNPTVTFTYKAPKMDYAKVSVTSPYSVTATVSNMTYGYKITLDGNRVATPSYSSTANTATYLKSNPSGSILVGKISGNNNIDTTSCGSIVNNAIADTSTATWDFEVPAKSLTNSGSVTAISGGTFFGSSKLTWTPSGSIIPNDVNGLFYCNNKLETDNDHETNGEGSDIPRAIILPTTHTGNRSTKLYKYKVYLPILLYKGNTKLSIGDLKYYGSNNTNFSFKLTTTLSGETESNAATKISLYIPLSSNLKNNIITLQGANYEMVLSSENTNMAINGVLLPYKKYNFLNGFNGAGTANTDVKITLQNT